MTQHEIYTFILCFIVFVALTSLFTALIAVITKLIVKLIRNGTEDAEILKEYQENLREEKASRTWEIAGAVFSSIICFALFITFLFSLILNLTESQFTSGIPSLKVVKSESMSERHGDNRHLHDNGIDNQLQMYDLIITSPLPAEDALSLYDVVVYEKNGDLIIHRIVGIEEPNEKHPHQRYFTLQGDALKYTDEFPVTYDQMRASWSGKRIPFVGSFIMFMQSPAGWLCVLLVFFALIATPVVEKKILREKQLRLEVMRFGAKHPQKRLPLRIPAVPIVLSHFRLMLQIQKGKPQMTLTVHKSSGTPQKRVSSKGVGK